MKVLMIPSWYPAPSNPLLGTFFKEQAEALVKKGIEVAVIHASVGSNFNFGNGISRKIVNGVLTYTYTRTNLTPKWEYGRRIQRTLMLNKLYKRVEKEWGKPDVVNLRSSLHGYEAISLCKKYGLPMFFMEHSSYVMTEKPDSTALKRLKAVMNYADVNACVSSALQSVLEQYGEARVIPDPVDGELFCPKQTPYHPEFIFRAMGQLRPLKGYDTLIKAFGELQKNAKRSIRLEIAGTGVLQEKLQNLIDDLKINDTCSLIGSVPRSNAPDFMNGCDCFICSSRIETLSCVLNEAAACGKPVISTRCGGPQDIVNEDIGLLVPVDNVEAMADAMKKMVKTAGDYDYNRIRKLTLQRFGRDIVCRLLIDACYDTVSNKSGGADV